MKIFNKQETIEKRKALRKNQTDAERLIWANLRNKQLRRYKFFRQYGIGSYIVDFYCPQSKLAIEIDGGQHYTDEGQAYDKQREEYMSSAGITTIRFSNLDVLTNIDGVIQRIDVELPPSPSLLKRGSEGMQRIDTELPPSPSFVKRGSEVMQRIDVELPPSPSFVKEGERGDAKD